MVYVSAIGIFSILYLPFESVTALKVSKVVPNSISAFLTGCPSKSFTAPLMENFWTTALKFTVLSLSSLLTVTFWGVMTVPSFKAVTKYVLP